MEARPGESHQLGFSRRHHRGRPTGGRRASGSAYLRPRLSHRHSRQRPRARSNTRGRTGSRGRKSQRGKSRVGAWEPASRGSPSAPPRRRCSRLQSSISLPTPPPGTRRRGTLLGADPCGDPGLESPRPGMQVPAAWHPAGRSDPASPLSSGALRISCKEQESGVGRG